MEWITPFAILLSLLLIGFFAGIEIAFISANKLSIELKKKQGTFSGKIWGEYADKPAQFIGTTLVGFNIMLVIYGLLFSSFILPFWELKFWQKFNTENPYLRLVVETVFSTYILLLFEFVFKAFFRAKNESILSSGFLSYITSFFFYVFSGIASIFVEIA
jgi:CBS domain containing-hemolysin-like protein